MQTWIHGGIKGWCLLAYSFFYIIDILIWKPLVVRSCLEPHLWRKAFRSLANFSGESCRGGMLQKYGYSEPTTMLYITCNMLPGPMWSWWFRQSTSGGWEAGEMVKRNPGVTSVSWKSDCNRLGNSPDSTRAPRLNRQQYHKKCLQHECQVGMLWALMFSFFDPLSGSNCWVSPAICRCL